MLVKESTHDVKTTVAGEGQMRIYVFHPTIPGYPNAKFPGVVVFSEIYQVTGPVARFARMIAGQGYICAAPSSYHEFTGPEPLQYNAEDTDNGNKWKITKKVAAYDEDARLCVDYLLSLPTATAAWRNWDVSGKPIWRIDVHSTPASGLLQSLGEGKNDDSLQRAGDIKGELVMIFGKNDNHVPAPGRDLIRSTLHEKGYAFIRDELSKGRYDPALTKVCAEMMFEVFGRTLKVELGEGDGKELVVENVC
ncbi:dienelactone hydrolase [Nannizzia gypsea CBS 118893]|uniref:Dienelactone hydrolase n=1 Tax=Arthroderma gypseum (strain ATCC MYA-4604 / CBS 118893) TaxID=535722 RepID=E4UZ75_ARTGP|nr:dienelactone hydrolase [Nannizzia gypsea CBS 118893]EFR03405.1 dienelactone hydrolase [Nannizzia gypsea CBS 118893]